MKKMIKAVKKQRGFALIEVMLAALVMTVGGVAYMKLQQRGLQSGFNNYARSQGIAITQNFVEQLRSNVGYVKTSTDAEKKISASESVANPAVPDCNSSQATCSNSIFDFQNNLIRKQMQAVSANSILCYRRGSNGYVRVTYIWPTNSQLSNNTDAGLQCPGLNAATNQNNSVTIYAQL